MSLGSMFSAIHQCQNLFEWNAVTWTGCECCRDIKLTCLSLCCRVYVPSHCCVLSSAAHVGQPQLMLILLRICKFWLSLCSVAAVCCLAQWKARPASWKYWVLYFWRLLHHIMVENALITTCCVLCSLAAVCCVAQHETVLVDWGALDVVYLKNVASFCYCKCFNGHVVMCEARRQHLVNVDHCPNNNNKKKSCKIMVSVFYLFHPSVKAWKWYGSF